MPNNRVLPGQLTSTVDADSTVDVARTGGLVDKSHVAYATTDHALAYPVRAVAVTVTVLSSASGSIAVSTTPPFPSTIRRPPRRRIAPPGRSR